MEGSLTAQFFEHKKSPKRGSSRIGGCFDMMVRPPF
jgi:hypothetical protein